MSYQNSRSSQGWKVEAGSAFKKPTKVLIARMKDGFTIAHLDYVLNMNSRENLYPLLLNFRSICSHDHMKR